jgi:hypothetical protein
MAYPFYVDTRAGLHGVRAHREVVTDLRGGRHRAQPECRNTGCRNDGRTRSTSVEKAITCLPLRIVPCSATVRRRRARTCSTARCRCISSPIATCQRVNEGASLPHNSSFFGRLSTTWGYAHGCRRVWLGVNRPR